MIKVLEKMVNLLSMVIFKELPKKESDVNKKEKYVISSVFPSTRVMKEVEKHI